MQPVTRSHLLLRSSYWKLKCRFLNEFTSAKHVTEPDPFLTTKVCELNVWERVERIECCAALKVYVAVQGLLILFFFFCWPSVIVVCALSSDLVAVSQSVCYYHNDKNNWYYVAEVVTLYIHLTFTCTLWNRAVPKVRLIHRCSKPVRKTYICCIPDSYIYIMRALIIHM